MRCPRLYWTAPYLGHGMRADAEAVSALERGTHWPTKHTDLQRVLMDTGSDHGNCH